MSSVDASSASSSAGSASESASSVGGPPAAASAAEAASLAASDAHKEAANRAFAEGRYIAAVSGYTAALDALTPPAGLESASLPADSAARKQRLVVLYSNRAFATLKLENYGSAIVDAGSSIALDPAYIKAYYRRASANMALNKHKAAKSDLRIVLRQKPGDVDATAKLAECDKAITRAAFFEAVATEHSKPLEDRIDVGSIGVEASYSGPVLPAVPADGAGASPERCAADESAVNAHGISLGFVKQLMADFRAQRPLHRKYALQLLLRVKPLLARLPSLVHVPFPEGALRFNVCGDTHGQYYDTLNIFDRAGMPSPANPFLFNGDFVDRGSFSCENVLTLLAFKLLYPDSMHLTRGNHETVNMNKMYGFEGEVRHKFDGTTMEVFTEVFRVLPLAVVVDRKVIVMHGGLFQRDGVTLEEIARIPRFREPSDEGLMSDILWSDPQPFSGRGPSKRGVGQSFGPDVTAAFLDSNGLELIIRSHEVMEEGYQLIHGGRLITVFSAPNYCDSMGNKGAVVQLDRACKPSFLQFDSVPHPPVRPMAYAAGMNMYGL